MDRYTKAVLTVIAVALVLLVAQPLYAPKPVQATDTSPWEDDLRGIRGQVALIATGFCVNDKLC